MLRSPLLSTLLRCSFARGALPPGGVIPASRPGLVGSCPFQREAVQPISAPARLVKHQIMQHPWDAAIREMVSLLLIPGEGRVEIFFSVIFVVLPLALWPVVSKLSKQQFPMSPVPKSARTAVYGTQS